MILEESEIKDLLESVKLVYGYDFTQYAGASVKRRLEQFMNNRQIPGLAVLKTLLISDEKLFEMFIQEITVTVTEMFRDPAFYKSLRENVLKRLGTYPFLKIWIAGCATGEEVYSIAIILQEEGILHRSVIYATDINQRSLQVAKAGTYPVKVIGSYAENYLKCCGKAPLSQYYTTSYNSVTFDDSLKKNIVFSAHSLVTDKSFNEFQLIICRNVLIYFNKELQDKVFDLFYESLCSFGFLGLGNKESLLFSEKKRYFEEIDRKEKIFMKK